MEMTNVTNTKKQWPAVIHEVEREVFIFANDNTLIDHIKSNEPSTACYLELTPDDESTVADLFAEDGTAGAVGPLSLDTYAKDLGLN